MATSIVLDFDSLSESDAKMMLFKIESMIANSYGMPRIAFHGGHIQNAVADDEVYDGSSVGGCE